MKPNVDLTIHPQCCKYDKFSVTESLNNLFDRAVFGDRVYVHYNVINMIQEYQQDK